MAGATQVPLWENTEEIERAVPQVDLTMGPPRQSLPGQAGQRALESPPDAKV
jgi:hypothetical protein